MSSWSFFKVFGDVCLYFTLISALPTFFPCRFEFYIPALACAAGAAIAHSLSKIRPALRYLGCLLPLCSIFLARNVNEIIILFPAIVYCLAVILRANPPEYYRYLRFYKKLIFFLCAVLIVFYIISELLITLSRIYAFDLGSFATYGLLSVISGVFLMRSLRLGNLTEHGTNRRQLIFTVGATASFVLIGIASERILMKHGRSVVEFILSMLKTILAIPVYIVLLILGRSDKQERKEVEEAIITEMTEASEELPSIQEPVREIANTSPQPTEENFPWWIAVIIMLILAVILIFVFRLHQQRTDQTGTEETTQRLPKKKKHKSIQINNCIKIRRCYREFLKYQKANGMKLYPHQTSLDILENLPSKKNLDNSVYLRELYISARYDDECEITSRQINEAHSALNKIRKK